MSDYRTRDGLRDVTRGGVVALWGGIVAVVVILAIFAIGVFGFGWFQQKTADFRGETQKRNQVEANGAFRTQAYDHFFGLCAQVLSDEASVKNLQEELKTKPPADRVTQINGSITALRNNRAETINTYNTDANKDYTVGQFRSSNLPFQLDIDAKETKCAA